MTNTELIKKWKKEEENFSLTGWDFSVLEGKWDYPDPPWDYKMIVKSYLRGTDRLLDMGTGGGEVLLTIGHPYEKTYVTEAYEPNLELCKRELSPLGITVKQTFTDDKLPFEDDFFDFIINRHESFDLTEVNRVLKPAGYFFTQQVGGRNFHELIAKLNDDIIPPNPNHEIEKYADTMKQLGFQIIMRDEAIFPVKFFDVGAVIFDAKACPWEFPDFSVEMHFEKLCEIQREIDEHGFFQVTGHRFLLAGRKL